MHNNMSMENTVNGTETGIDANSNANSTTEPPIVDNKKEIDRLTQLQILIDQLLEQFLLSLTYINNKHKLNGTEPKEEFDDKQFNQNLEELSNDLIIKCRQILKLIDLLPDAIDEKEEENQITRIKDLSKELEDIEVLKKEKLIEKDELMKKLGSLIKEFISL